MIGVAAFGGCKNLKKIESPNAVTEIDGAAFIEAGLKEMILPAHWRSQMTAQKAEDMFGDDYKKVTLIYKN